MEKLNRLLTNIITNKLVESRDFYSTLFDFKVDFDSDWFVHLISADKSLEIGLINENSEIVPEGLEGNQSGFYLTLVVQSADKVFDLAKSKNFEIVSEPADTFYGQRRFLLKDPNGMIIDVSSPIPNFEF